MALKITANVRNDRASVILDALDAGSGAGYVEMYTGVQPATPETATASNTLLGTLTLTDPAGVVTNGVLAMNAIGDDNSADTTGTLTWCRWYDSDGNAVLDMDVGVAGSGATAIATTVDIVSGGVLRINSANFTEGGA